MAVEPPTPKTTFSISPAKPKGTIADHVAGNLPPPRTGGLEEAREARIAKRNKPKRRQPNPPKFADKSDEELRRAMRVEEEIEAPTQGQPSPYARVLADLEFKRRQIDTAIKALRELYE